MSIDAPTITIPLKEYNQMKHELKWLEYLDAAGIDNSEAYDYACQLAREDGYFDESE